MKPLHPDSHSAIAAIRNNAKPEDRIGFVSGNFNVIHPGHLRLLRFAAECCDFLVIGVLANEVGAVVVDESHRLEAMDSVSWGDHVFILRDQPHHFVERLQPAVVVKGNEHEQRENLERDAVESYGGRLLFGSGDLTFSSVNLLAEEFHRLPTHSIQKPADFAIRHGFEIANLAEVIGKMSDLYVVIIGDTIVDEYITCDPVGLSREDPTIVVTPIMQKRFVGAAGIVAGHAAGMGARVSFFSLVGDDAEGEFAEEVLREFGVTPHLLIDKSRPTTLKQRFRAENKTLLRVNRVRQHEMSRELCDTMLARVEAALDGADVVFFSDFNYGCLPQHFVDRVIDSCRERNVMMVADSQSSSQVGDVSRFQHMALMTPTEHEARLAVRDFHSGLVVLAEKLRQESCAENIIVTLGSEGVLIHAALTESERWLTDRLKAMNQAPKDPAGAGDSLLTGAALALAVGANIWEAAFLGSIAAAHQVGRLGNTPLRSKELVAELLR